MKFLWFVLSVLIWTTSFATNEPKLDQVSGSKDQVDTVTVVRYCPDKKELRRDNMVWVVGEQWKSYGESFATEINSFIGAQWVGVKLGKIICLYDNKDALDFPIALEPTVVTLVLEPNGDNWSSNIKGYRICHSTSTKDCSFLVEKEKPPVPVYEEIKYNPKRIDKNGD